MRLVLAARQSHLARLQAKIVGNLLERTFPDVQVEYAFRESLGDKNATQPLWQMPEKGVFTQDFVSDLVEGKCDLVVHSWKDLPTEERPDTVIVATLPRADVRDLLLMRRDRFDPVARTKALKVLTSSPRRSYNLESFLGDALPWEIEDLQFLPVRGNVTTRLRKLLEGDADCLIMAKAAVDRLLETEEPDLLEGRDAVRSALNQCHWMVLPVTANPSAAAQGALAIEIAAHNTEMKERLAAITHESTFRDVSKEREILASHGGGCHQKIGINVLSKPYGTVTCLKGKTDQGVVLDQVELTPSTPYSPPVSQECLWPLKPVRDVFQREPIPVEEPPRNTVDAFFVAKAGALPEIWSLADRPLVWVSGLETWKKLADRGIWVNGSSESLGESEEPQVETLWDRKPMWVKLTHEKGYASDRYRVMPTYRLNPRETFPDLTGKTHFFWASGSLFLRALEMHPKIKDAWHASGPGNTHAILTQHLGPSGKIQVFLNHAGWLQYHKEGKCHETVDAP